MPGIRIKKAESGLVAFWDIGGMADDEVSYIKETIGAHKSIIENSAFEGIFEEAEENSEKFAKLVAKYKLGDELTSLIEDKLYADENFWVFAYDRFLEDVGEVLVTKSAGGYWILDGETYITLDAGDDATALLSNIAPGFMDYAIYMYDNGEGLNIEFYDNEGNFLRSVCAMPSTDVIEMDLQDMEEVL